MTFLFIDGLRVNLIPIDRPVYTERVETESGVLETTRPCLNINGKHYVPVPDAEAGIVPQHKDLTDWDKNFSDWADDIAKNEHRAPTRMEVVDWIDENVISPVSIMAYLESEQRKSAEKGWTEALQNLLRTKQDCGKSVPKGDGTNLAVTVQYLIENVIDAESFKEDFHRNPWLVLNSLTNDGKDSPSVITEKWNVVRVVNY